MSIININHALPAKFHNSFFQSEIPLLITLQDSIQEIL